MERTGSEQGLRRLIRALLREGLPPPDEPDIEPDEAMGQYLMPTGRVDPRYENVPEESTRLERAFEDALYQHYEANETDQLAKIWDQVWELVERGLYSEFLVAPDRRAWRLMSKVPPGKLAGMLGLDEEEVTGRPNEAQVSQGPVTYRRRLEGGETDLTRVSSWTLQPEDIDPSAFISQSPGECSVLVSAPTSGGEFLMNPHKFTREFRLGKKFADEYEVISRGPVEGARVAWIYHSPRSTEWKSNIIYARRILSRDLGTVVDLWMMDRDGEGGMREAFTIWSDYMKVVRFEVLEVVLGKHDAQQAIQEYMHDANQAAGSFERFSSWLRELPSFEWGETDDPMLPADVTAVIDGIDEMALWVQKQSAKAVDRAFDATEKPMEPEEILKALLSALALARARERAALRTGA
jgi:hypothetical protein